jgi:hypothetical protein
LKGESVEALDGLRLNLRPVQPIQRLKPFNLDAAVEQRRREDAKAENKEWLAFSPVPADVTWQVNPPPLSLLVPRPVLRVFTPSLFTSNCGF